MKDDNNPAEMAKAIAAIAKEVPIYNDAIQPAAKQLGKGLETLAKAVNMALAPLEGVVWGYDQIKQFFINKVTEKLKHIPEENIVTPPSEIAGPAIEALRFAGKNEDLADMYANLIATSMDIKTIKYAHPSYVEILKQLSSDEAKILKHLSHNQRIPNIHVQIKDGIGEILFVANICMLSELPNYTNDSFTSEYIDNIERLGLIINEKNKYITDENQYKKLLECKLYTDTLNTIKQMKREPKTVKGFIQLTSFGIAFINACVNDKRNTITVYPKSN